MTFQTCAHKDACQIGLEKPGFSRSFVVFSNICAFFPVQPTHNLYGNRVILANKWPIPRQNKKILLRFGPVFFVNDVPPCVAHCLVSVGRERPTIPSKNSSPVLHKNETTGTDVLAEINGGFRFPFPPWNHLPTAPFLSPSVPGTATVHRPKNKSQWVKLSLSPSPRLQQDTHLTPWSPQTGGFRWVMKQAGGKRDAPFPCA